jgi:hypothetical protein
MSRLLLTSNDKTRAVKTMGPFSDNATERLSKNRLSKIP